MKVNPKFNTSAVRERLRMIKKKWRSLPDPKMLYKEFRNKAIMAAGRMYQARQMVTKMVSDMRIQKATEIYSRNQILKKLSEN